jgi:putative transposase
MIESRAPVGHIKGRDGGFQNDEAGRAKARAGPQPPGAAHGLVLERRFYSSVIQSDRYLLACHRYIEMNPVRAGIVPAPRLYRWSSYRRNAEGLTCPIVTPHSLYLELGSTPERRERPYRAMFSDVLDATLLEQFRTAARASRAVGDEDFHRELGSQLGVCTYARKPGRPVRFGFGVVGKS